jgi:holo-[acyl-carrier protein] synthase
MQDDGVVASAREVLAIAEVTRLLSAAGPGAFSPGEQAYAHSKVDPERRLAARLAAKRAALRLLGGGLAERDVEVVRGRGGPPSLQLSPRATERLHALGATSVLVSLTHGETHAAASVLLLRDTSRGIGCEG